MAWQIARTSPYSSSRESNGPSFTRYLFPRGRREQHPSASALDEKRHCELWTEGEAASSLRPMAKKRLSPREKKELSYDRDRRNTYGENDKASRKSIPLRKRLQNKRERKQASQGLAPGVVPA